MDKELREKIARVICAQYKGVDWDYDYPYQKAESLREADRFLALIKEAGYVSPVVDGDKQTESRLLTPEEIKEIESNWFSNPIESREDPEILIAKAQRDLTASFYAGYLSPSEVAEARKEEQVKRQKLYDACLSAGMGRNSASPYWVLWQP